MLRLNSFLNNFSGFPLTLLTTLCHKKFYLDEILLHVPVTYDEESKCSAYYTHVLQYLSPNRCEKPTCSLYTSTHYNRDITVFVSEVHKLMTVVTFTEEIVTGWT